MLSEADRIVVRLEVPSPEVARVEGEFCLLSIPGYNRHAVPGEPALPTAGFWIAVPPNCTPRLEIIDQSIEPRTFPPVLPAPHFLPPQNDGEKGTWSSRPGPVYGRSAYFPETMLSCSPPSVYRGQPLVSVRFFPVRSNPVDGRALFCRSITFALYFDGATVSAGSAGEADPLLKALVLNPERLTGRSTPIKAAADDYFLNRADEWYKIEVTKDGLYRISAEELQRAGIDLRSSNPRRLAVFNRGQEVAVRVIGEEDGRWDDGDAVEFYGESYKDFYNSRNVYWLTPNGGDGLRMETVAAAPIGSARVIETGTAFLRYEIDRIYRADFPGHTNNERWFMDRLQAPQTVSYTVTLDEPAADDGTYAVLKFRLQAIAQDLSINPDHHTQIRVNETVVHDVFWDGRIAYTDSVSFSPQLLKDGDNLIQFVGPGDTGSFLDWSLIDWFALSYPRRNRALGGMLRFYSASGNGTFRLFDLGRLADIYDITDPQRVCLLKNVAVEEGNRLFSLSKGGPAKIMAVTAGAKLSASLQKAPTYRLRLLRPPCDYLIITVPAFHEALEPLAAFHRQRGLNVMIVDADEIYDEFNFGLKSERAVRSYLTFAYHGYASPPQYVLLVGDASWNPRNINPESPAYGGGAETDLVPTRLFESSVDHFEACSDNWFACVDGDSDVLPDMFVGRLPARSSAQVEQMVRKILAYQAAQDQPAFHRCVFVADIGEGGTLAFEDSSTALANRFIPGTMAAEKIYLSQLGEAATKESIKQAFGRGALFMNYFGHGSVGTWSAKSILSRKDVADLPPSEVPPFLFTMSCINGYFADPNDLNASLVELLMRQDRGGIIAGFTASGQAFPSPLFAMANTLYASLFRYGHSTVGSFCTAGLFAMYAAYPSFDDHVQFYLLFGDPAFPLRVPRQETAQAGFMGSIRLSSGAAARGDTLTAFIAGERLASGLVNAGGAFGPIFIPADDPATPQKEGGVAGDSVSFFLHRQTDRLALFPRVPWLAGQVQTLRLSDLPTRVEETPQVEFAVDGVSCRNPEAGDPISRSAVITVRLKTSGSPLPPPPTLRLNGETIHEATMEAASGRLTLTLAPLDLPDGDYELCVLPPSDNGALWGRLSFRISSKIKLSNVVNFPNPCRDRTRFTFMLENNRPARATIRIYTVSGRLIAVIREAAADVGFNEISWDVADEHGQELANGLYFYKMSVDDGEERAEVIERLVVMK